jgi:CheY-like chemotaxis protein
MHVQIQNSRRPNLKSTKREPEAQPPLSTEQCTPITSDATDYLAIVLLIAQKKPLTLTDLHYAGYRAVAVNYAEFSAEAISKVYPKVIILDVSVPVNIALALGNFIKSHPPYRNIPVLMLLRRLSDYPLPAGSPFRPDLTLIEPFTLGELRRGVNLLMESKRASSGAPRPNKRPGLAWVPANRFQV